MLQKEIEEVMTKLVAFSDEALRKFEKKISKNQFSKRLLASAQILSQFKQVHNKDTLYLEKDNKMVLFLDTSIIFQAVEEMNTPIQEKATFLEWYLQQWVGFFTIRPLESYVMAGHVFIGLINQYLNIPKEEEKNIECILKQSDKEQKSYTYYKQIALKMDKVCHHLLCTQQYDLLALLGMSSPFLSQIKQYYVSEISHSYALPVQEKQKNNLKSTSVPKVVSLKKLDLPEEKSGPSNRQLKAQLNEYFDEETLQNRRILEGADFVQVDEILQQLYPSPKFLFVEKIIESNNKQMKEEREQKLLEELIPNEEYFKLYREALVFLTQKDSFFSMLAPVVERIVSEVNSYIDIYKMLSEEEKESFRESCIGAIHSSLEELLLHIDFLPEAFRKLKL